MKIILASSSIYRKQLLQRLQINFECISPDIDEQKDNNLSSEDNSILLSRKKAEAIAVSEPDALVIASDQICVMGNEILGKPLNYENAYKQLNKVSGKKVTFYTGLCVYNPPAKEYILDCDKTIVYFRNLTHSEINRYLLVDEPYQCAGSFKAESLGISLFKRIQNDDPTALIGLPLIKLCSILRAVNIM